MDKKRFLEPKVNKLLEMFPVVAIIGPRQCGKSTLATGSDYGTWRGEIPWQDAGLPAAAWTRIPRATDRKDPVLRC